MHTKYISNPILPGTNPDPSILNVDGRYYIAVSTFTWYPGIRVYESEDLREWHYHSDILTQDAIDLRGVEHDGGIWAPQISYHKGQYYCVYTIVTSNNKPFKDAHNYVITSSSLRGPWSKPHYLISNGFDPSLFFENDQAWFLYTKWDFRKQSSNKSAGIWMQSFDLKSNKLTGTLKQIFSGTPRAKTEAPHLYKIDGMYYLLSAEGGTGIGHCVTVCRAKNVEGPYEPDPRGPMLTSSDDPSLILQCAGHGSLVRYKNHFMMAHLCTRPFNRDDAVLGRETALQPVVMESGWLRLIEGHHPKPYVEGLRAIDRNRSTTYYTLTHHFNALRIPIEGSWCMKTSEGLRMKSQESIHSRLNQSLIALRQTHHTYDVSLMMDACPLHAMQLAGLVHYHSPSSYQMLAITFHEEIGPCLRVVRQEQDDFRISNFKIPIQCVPLELRFKTNDTGTHGQYAYRYSGDVSWNWIEEQYALQYLSGGYTGNFIGLGVYDLESYGGWSATCKYFKTTQQKEEITWIFDTE